jgi:hypothetical protein
MGGCFANLGMFTDPPIWETTSNVINMGEFKGLVWVHKVLQPYALRWSQFCSICCKALEPTGTGYCEHGPKPFKKSLKTFLFMKHYGEVLLNSIHTEERSTNSYTLWFWESQHCQVLTSTVTLFFSWVIISRMDSRLCVVIPSSNTSYRTRRWPGLSNMWVGTVCQPWTKHDELLLFPRMTKG